VASDKVYFTQRINELQQTLITTADVNDAISVVTGGLTNILRDRAAAGYTVIKDSLRDLLLWTRTLLDGLDTLQLAEEQAHKWEEVWVFAPRPLETVELENAGNLRDSVRTNILKKNTKYETVASLQSDP
jgi:hypothetical protein